MASKTINEKLDVREPSIQWKNDFGLEFLLLPLYPVVALKLIESLVITFYCSSDNKIHPVES
jgi:hypothetical protein